MATVVRGLLIGLGFSLLLALAGCGYHGGHYGGYYTPAFDIHLSHFGHQRGHHLNRHYGARAHLRSSSAFRGGHHRIRHGRHRNARHGGHRGRH